MIWGWGNPDEMMMDFGKCSHSIYESWQVLLKWPKLKKMRTRCAKCPPSWGWLTWDPLRGIAWENLARISGLYRPLPLGSWPILGRRSPSEKIGAYWFMKAISVSEEHRYFGGGRPRYCIFWSHGAPLWFSPTLPVKYQWFHCWDILKTPDMWSKLVWGELSRLSMWYIDSPSQRGNQKCAIMIFPPKLRSTWSYIARPVFRPKMC